MSTASKSDFAREHDVTPTAVTHWIRQGLAILNHEGRVEREISNRKLANRPLVYRGGRLGGTPRGGPWATDDRCREQDWEIELISETLRRLRADGVKLATPAKLVKVANEVLAEWRGDR